MFSTLAQFSIQTEAETLTKNTKVVIEYYISFLTHPMAQLTPDTPDTQDTPLQDITQAKTISLNGTVFEVTEVQGDIVKLQKEGAPMSSSKTIEFLKEKQKANMLTILR